MNFTIFKVTNAEPGKCVPAQGDRIGLVLTLVFPKLSNITLSVIKPEIEIDEDEIDPTGEQVCYQLFLIRYYKIMQRQRLLSFAKCVLYNALL